MCRQWAARQTPSSPQPAAAARAFRGSFHGTRQPGARPHLSQAGSTRLTSAKRFAPAPFGQLAANGPKYITIRTDDDQVVELGAFKKNVPPHAVIHDNPARQRVLDAHQRVNSITRRGAITARPVVIIESEPLHTVENCCDILLGGSLLVCILNPENKLTTALASVRPARQRRAEAAKVQHASRAWRKFGRPNSSTIRHSARPCRISGDRYIVKPQHPGSNFSQQAFPQIFIIQIKQFRNTDSAVQFR